MGTQAVRPHRSAEERSDYLARFEKSGISAVAFCREHGLCKQTFYNWRQKARRMAGAPSRRVPAFAEVSVSPVPEVAGAIFVHLAAGLSIEASTGTDPAWLARVVNGLRAL